MILNCLEVGTASFGSFCIRVSFATGTLPCFPSSVPCSFEFKVFGGSKISVIRSIVAGLLLRPRYYVPVIAT